MKTNLGMRFTSVFVLTAFLVTNHSMPQAGANVGADPRVRPMPGDANGSTHGSTPTIDDFRIPEELGTIQESYQGSRENTLLLIQDAHSIPDAQRNIQKLIQHFQKQYGIHSVALEGAPSELDPQIFRSFPDKKALASVFEGYIQRAEVPAGAAAAVLGSDPNTPGVRPHQTRFHGVENWDLYEEGAAFYLKAMEKEGEILEKLKAEGGKLKAEKEKFYTHIGARHASPLREIDEALEKFYENEMNLAEAVKALRRAERIAHSAKHTEKGTGNRFGHMPVPFSIVPGPALSALIERLEHETPVSLDIEVKRVARSVGRALRANVGADPRVRPLQGAGKRVGPTHGSAPTIDGNVVREFNARLQQYRTSQISAETFALYLKEIIEHHHLPIPTSRLLQQSAHQEQRLRDIQGTELFEEFEAYAESVVEQLISNVGADPRVRPFALDGDLSNGPRDTDGPTHGSAPTARSLHQKTQHLRLLTRLAKLELTRKEWEEIRGRKAEGGKQGVESRKQKAESRKQEAGEADWRGFESYLAFYKNAERREEAMFRNLLRNTHDAIRNTILVAGGFHTEGLTKRLKEQGISYVLVMPKIEHIPDQTHYREHMKGNVSWKDYFVVEKGRINLYEAFVRGARDRLLGEEGRRQKAEGGKNNPAFRVPPSAFLLKRWRDQIILDLAAQNRIGDASQYTRFLDELNPSAFRVPPSAFQRQWRSNILRFLRGIRRLEKEGKLTEQNILNLIQPSTMPARMANASLLAPSAWTSESYEVGIVHKPEQRDRHPERSEGSPRSFGLRPQDDETKGLGLPPAPRHPDTPIQRQAKSEVRGIRQLITLKSVILSFSVIAIAAGAILSSRLPSGGKFRETDLSLGKSNIVQKAAVPSQPTVVTAVTNAAARSAPAGIWSATVHVTDEIRIQRVLSLGNEEWIKQAALAAEAAQKEREKKDRERGKKENEIRRDRIASASYTVKKVIRGIYFDYSAIDKIVLHNQLLFTGDLETGFFDITYKTSKNGKLEPALEAIGKWQSRISTIADNISRNTRPAEIEFLAHRLGIANRIGFSPKLFRQVAQTNSTGLAKSIAFLIARGDLEMDALQAVMKYDRVTRDLKINLARYVNKPWMSFLYKEYYYTQPVSREKLDRSYQRTSPHFEKLPLSQKRKLTSPPLPKSKPAVTPKTPPRRSRSEARQLNDSQGVAVPSERILKAFNNGPVKSAQFSADGTKILMIEDGRWISLWNAVTGEHLWRKGYAWRCDAALFNRDETKVITVGKDDEWTSIRILNAQTGEVESEAGLFGPNTPVGDLVFSRDRTKFLRIGGGSVILYDFSENSSHPLKTLDSYGGAIAGAFSADGKRIATGGEEGTVKIWDAETGALVSTLGVRSSPILSLAFSPDGKSVASGHEGSVIRILSLQEAGKIAPSKYLSDHGGWVKSVAFSGNGERLVSGSSDRTAKIWDVAREKLLMTVTGHRDGIQSAEFSPDVTRLLIGSWDGTARIWDLGLVGFNELIRKDRRAIMIEVAEGASYIFDKTAIEIEAQSEIRSSPDREKLKAEAVAGVWAKLHGLGSLDELRGMNLQQFVSRIGGIKVVEHTGISRPVFTLPEQLFKNLEIFRAAGRIPPGVSAAPYRAFKDKPEIDGPGIYVSFKDIEETHRNVQRLGSAMRYNKGLIVHELLEQAFEAANLTDPFLYLFKQHTDARVIEEEMLFSALMGEQDVRETRAIYEEIKEGIEDVFLEFSDEYFTRLAQQYRGVGGEISSTELENSLGVQSPYYQTLVWASTSPYEKLRRAGEARWNAANFQSFIPISRSEIRLTLFDRSGQVGKGEKAAMPSTMLRINSDQRSDDEAVRSEMRGFTKGITAYDSFQAMIEGLKVQYAPNGTREEGGYFDPIRSGKFQVSVPQDAAGGPAHILLADQHSHLGNFHSHPKENMASDGDLDTSLHLAPQQISVIFAPLFTFVLRGGDQSKTYALTNAYHFMLNQLQRQTAIAAVLNDFGRYFPAFFYRVGIAGYLMAFQDYFGVTEYNQNTWISIWQKIGFDVQVIQHDEAGKIVNADRHPAIPINPEDVNGMYEKWQQEVRTGELWVKALSDIFIKRVNLHLTVKGLENEEAQKIINVLMKLFFFERIKNIFRQHQSDEPQISWVDTYGINPYLEGQDPILSGEVREFIQTELWTQTISQSAGPQEALDAIVNSDFILEMNKRRSEIRAELTSIAIDQDRYSLNQLAGQRLRSEARLRPSDFVGQARRTEQLEGRATVLGGPAKGEAVLGDKRQAGTSPSGRAETRTGYIYPSEEFLEGLYTGPAFEFNGSVSGGEQGHWNVLAKFSPDLNISVSIEEPLIDLNPRGAEIYHDTRRGGLYLRVRGRISKFEIFRNGSRFLFNPSTIKAEIKLPQDLFIVEGMNVIHTQGGKLLPQVANQLIEALRSGTDPKKAAQEAAVGMINAMIEAMPGVVRQILEHPPKLVGPPSESVSWIRDLLRAIRGEEPKNPFLKRSAQSSGSQWSFTTKSALIRSLPVLIRDSRISLIQLPGIDGTPQRLSVNELSDQEADFIGRLMPFSISNDSPAQVRIVQSRDGKNTLIISGRARSEVRGVDFFNLVNIERAAQEFMVNGAPWLGLGLGIAAGFVIASIFDKVKVKFKIAALTGAAGWISGWGIGQVFASRFAASKTPAVKETPFTELDLGHAVTEVSKAPSPDIFSSVLQYLTSGSFDAFLIWCAMLILFGWGGLVLWGKFSESELYDRIADWLDSRSNKSPSQKQPQVTEDLDTAVLRSLLELPEGVAVDVAKLAKTDSVAIMEAVSEMQRLADLLDRKQSLEILPGRILSVNGLLDQREVKREQKIVYLNALAHRLSQAALGRSEARRTEPLEGSATGTRRRARAEARRSLSVSGAEIARVFEKMAKRPLKVQGVRNHKSYEIHTKISDIPQSSRKSVKVSYVNDGQTVGTNIMVFDPAQKENAFIQNLSILIPSEEHRRQGLTSKFNEELCARLPIGTRLFLSVDHHLSIFRIDEALARQIRTGALYEAMTALSRRYLEPADDEMQSAEDFLSEEDKAQMEQHIYKAYEQGFRLSSEGLGRIPPLGVLAKKLGPYQEIRPRQVNVDQISIDQIIYVGLESGPAARPSTAVGVTGEDGREDIRSEARTNFYPQLWLESGTGDSFTGTRPLLSTYVGEVDRNRVQTAVVEVDRPVLGVVSLTYPYWIAGLKHTFPNLKKIMVLYREEIEKTYAETFSQGWDLQVEFKKIESRIPELEDKQDIAILHSPFAYDLISTEIFKLFVGYNPDSLTMTSVDLSMGPTRMHLRPKGDDKRYSYWRSVRPFFSVLGIALPSKDSEIISIPSEISIMVQKKLQQQGYDPLSPLVLMSPQANNYQKDMEYVNWVELIQTLQKAGYQVAVNSHESKEGYKPLQDIHEARFDGPVYWVGADFSELIAVIRDFAQILVGAQSGVAHIGQILEKPHLVIVSDSGFKSEGIPPPRWFSTEDPYTGLVITDQHGQVPLDGFQQALVKLYQKTGLAAPVTKPLRSEARQTARRVNEGVEPEGRSKMRLPDRQAGEGKTNRISLQASPFELQAGDKVVKSRSEARPNPADSGTAHSTSLRVPSLSRGAFAPREAVSKPRGALEEKEDERISGGVWSRSVFLPTREMPTKPRLLQSLPRRRGTSFGDHFVPLFFSPFFEFLMSQIASKKAINESAEPAAILNGETGAVKAIIARKSFPMSNMDLLNSAFWTSLSFIEEYLITLIGGISRIAYSLIKNSTLVNIYFPARAEARQGGQARRPERLEGRADSRPTLGRKVSTIVPSVPTRETGTRRRARAEARGDRFSGPRVNELTATKPPLEAFAGFLKRSETRTNPPKMLQQFSSREELITHLMDGYRPETPNEDGGYFTGRHALYGTAEATGAYRLELSYKDQFYGIWHTHPQGIGSGFPSEPDVWVSMGLAVLGKHESLIITSQGTYLLSSTGPLRGAPDFALVDLLNEVRLSLEDPQMEFFQKVLEHGDRMFGTFLQEVIFGTLMSLLKEDLIQKFGSAEYHKIWIQLATRMGLTVKVIQKGTSGALTIEEHPEVMNAPNEWKIKAEQVRSLPQLRRLMIDAIIQNFLIRYGVWESEGIAKVSDNPVKKRQFLAAVYSIYDGLKGRGLIQYTGYLDKIIPEIFKARFTPILDESGTPVTDLRKAIPILTKLTTRSEARLGPANLHALFQPDEKAAWTIDPVISNAKKSELRQFPPEVLHAMRLRFFVQGREKRTVEHAGYFVTKDGQLKVIPVVHESNQDEMKALGVAVEPRVTLTRAPQIYGNYHTHPKGDHPSPGDFGFFLTNGLQGTHQNVIFTPFSTLSFTNNQALYEDENEQRYGLVYSWLQILAVLQNHHPELEKIFKKLADEYPGKVPGVPDVSFQILLDVFQEKLGSDFRKAWLPLAQHLGFEVMVMKYGSEGEEPETNVYPALENASEPWIEGLKGKKKALTSGTLFIDALCNFFIPILIEVTPANEAELVIAHIFGTLYDALHSANPALADYALEQGFVRYRQLAKETPSADFERWPGLIKEMGGYQQAYQKLMEEMEQQLQALQALLAKQGGESGSDAAKSELRTPREVQDWNHLILDLNKNYSPDYPNETGGYFDPVTTPAGPFTIIPIDNAPATAVSVTLPDKAKHYGDYHTHPRGPGSESPSALDLWNAIAGTVYGIRESVIVSENLTISMRNAVPLVSRPPYHLPYVTATIMGRWQSGPLSVFLPFIQAAEQKQLSGYTQMLTIEVFLETYREVLKQKFGSSKLFKIWIQLARHAGLEVRLIRRESDGRLAIEEFKPIANTPEDWKLQISAQEMERRVLDAVLNTFGNLYGEVEDVDKPRLSDKPDKKLAFVANSYYLIDHLQRNGRGDLSRVLKEKTWERFKIHFRLDAEERQAANLDAYIDIQKRRQGGRSEARLSPADSSTARSSRGAMSELRMLSDLPGGREQGGMMYSGDPDKAAEGTLEALRRLAKGGSWPGASSVEEIISVLRNYQSRHRGASKTGPSEPLLDVEPYLIVLSDYQRNKSMSFDQLVQRLWELELRFQEDILNKVLGSPEGKALEEMGLLNLAAELALAGEDYQNQKVRLPWLDQIFSESGVTKEGDKANLSGKLSEALRLQIQHEVSASESPDSKIRVEKIIETVVEALKPGENGEALKRAELRELPVVVMKLGAKDFADRALQMFESLSEGSGITDPEAAQLVIREISAALASRGNQKRAVAYAVTDENRGFIRAMEQTASSVGQLALLASEGRVPDSMSAAFRKMGLIYSVQRDPEKVNESLTMTLDPSQKVVGFVIPHGAKSEVRRDSLLVPIRSSEAVEDDPVMRDLIVAVQTAAALLLPERSRSELREHPELIFQEVRLFRGFEKRILTSGRDGSLVVQMAALRDYMNRRTFEQAA